MVNEDSKSPKHIILTALRESTRPITGENLGRHLGVSRVAVHKHIQFLKRSGYAIISDHAGYWLDDFGALPFTTWEFQPSENIQVLDSVGSTMDEAQAHSQKHRGKDFVIAALRQKKGRGRGERNWESPLGGLWATRVLHPSGTALSVQRCVMAAVVGLAMLLRDTKSLDVRVKWPNDVLIGGKKIAGILGEARISGDHIDYLALGLGMNVNNAVQNQNAEVLARLTGREEDRRSLLRGWIFATDSLLRSPDFHRNGDPRWWNAIMEGKQTTVSFIAAGKMLTGTVQGVDALGRLRLSRPGGSEIRLAAGDIEST